MLQPAIWIGYTDKVYASEEDNRKIKVAFTNVFITKYMRILMIGGHNQQDSNINIDYVIPGGWILKS